MNKRESLQKIQDQIRDACQKAGRTESSVKLVAVGKTKPWQDIVELAELGVSHFGENYVQEAQEKIETISKQNPKVFSQIQWHFIGSLQSNKAKFIPGSFTLLHSLDSESLAQKLHKASEQKKLKQSCLVEVNLDNEPTKGGIASSYLPNFLEKISTLTHIEVKGLMCIPEPKSGSTRKAFSELRVLLEKINASGSYPSKLTELSMGMSQDFSDAILEGATYIRVGTALFGERTKK